MNLTYLTALPTSPVDLQRRPIWLDARSLPRRRAWFCMRPRVVLGSIVLDCRTAGGCEPRDERVSGGAVPGGRGRVRVYGDGVVPAGYEGVGCPLGSPIIRHHRSVSLYPLSLFGLFLRLISDRCWFVGSDWHYHSIAIRFQYRNICITIGIVMLWIRSIM